MHRTKLAWKLLLTVTLGSSSLGLATAETANTNTLEGNPAATALRAEVEAIESAALSDAAFADLLTRLERAEQPQLLAQAYAVRCLSLLGSDANAAATVAEAGIVFAEKRSDVQALSGLYICRGYVRELDEQIDTAMADYDRAFEAAKRAGNRSDEAQAQALRGEIHYARGNFSQALSELLAAHRTSVEIADGARQRYALNAIANVYSDARVGQYAQALDYYRQVGREHEAAGNTPDVATNWFNIGSTLQITGEFAAAEEAFRKALAVYAQLDDARSLAQTRRALAVLYLRMDRPVEALAAADAALAFAEGNDPDFEQSNVDQPGVDQPDVEQSDVDQPGVDRPDVDQPDVDQAGVDQPDVEQPGDAASARLTRGSALRRLGRHAEAAADLASARNYFERNNNPRFVERAVAEQAEVAAAQGDWQAAYTARSEQLRLAEQLRSQADAELSSRLRVQFDSEHKELENTSLKREGELRSAALRDAERIRDLRGTAIALGTIVVLATVWVALSAFRRARQMRNLALTDELTGLANRRAILRQLEQRLAGKKHPAAPVLMFDIDHFKSINDRLGHDIGDVVLRKVALAAKRLIGGQGEVGRVGGEEFLVLLHAADADYLRAVAERLRQAVEALTFEAPATDLRVTISIGGCESGPHATRMEDLLKRVDLALYRAKSGGRNRVEFDPVS